MLVYLFGLLLFCIFGFGYSLEKNKAIQLLSIVILYLYFVFIFVFRGETVGTDTGGYIINFYKGYADYKGKLEPLFLYLNKVLNFFHLSYFSLFFIGATIIFFEFMFSFEKKHLFIIFPLLYIIVYIPSINVFRNFFGLSFAFLAMKKNNKISYIYFLLGFLIHKSIAIYFIIFIFSHYINLKQQYYYILGIILFGFILYGNFIDLLLYFLKFTPYNDYRWILSEIGKTSFSKITVIKYFLYYCMFFYNKSENKKQHSLTNMLITFLLIAEVVAKLNPIFFRLQVLFSPVLIIGISSVISEIQKNNKLKDKLYLSILISYTAFTFLINLKIGWNELVPYYFCSIY